MNPESDYANHMVRFRATRLSLFKKERGSFLILMLDTVLVATKKDVTNVKICMVKHPDFPCVCGRNVTVKSFMQLF